MDPPDSGAQNSARARGPAGRPAGPAGRPGRNPPARFAGPSLIYTCPQDRRRPQAEANKRRPGSANRTQGVARNSVEDTEYFKFFKKN